MTRIGIDARTGGGGSGGVEMFVLGLAQGFAQLTDGDEEYLFVARPASAGWLEPFLGGNCRLLAAAPAKPGAELPAAQRLAGRARYGLQKLREGRVAARTARRLGAPEGVAGSNGRIEAAGIDLMHFTLQSAFATGIPYVYHPHDLQHVHFPAFFTPEKVAQRDRVYRYFCENARLVATVSSWVKADVMASFGIDGDRVAVVPYAPPNLGYGAPDAAEIAATVAKYRLPDSFAFYPAQTWRHKNHIRLIEACALLRDAGGPVIPLVFSGQMNAHHREIAARAEALGMTGQLHFLGFVSPRELQCLYGCARCVVVPSLHEAASFPVWEAFHAGTPVACSSVTSLPGQVGDAGLLFDPENVEDIAATLRRLWTDAPLRRELARRGRQRVAQFTWARTCRLFRAHYRRILGRDLSREDRDLIAAEPLI